MGSLARIRIGVPRATPPLAIFYAIGVFWIVSSLAIALLVTVSLIVRLPVSALYFPATALAGSAAAVAVALRSGGWAAAIGLGLVAVVYVLLLGCEPNTPTPESCAAGFGPTVGRHLAEIIGAFAGLLFGRLIRPYDGASALLLAAGIIALAALGRIIFALDPVTGSAAYERFLWTVRLQTAAFVAGGVVLGWMVTRPLWPLLIIGAAVLIPWLGGTFRQWWQDMQDLVQHGFHLNVALIVQTEWRTFLPLIYFTCLLLGLIAARAAKTLPLVARGNRLPRSPAAS